MSTARDVVAKTARRDAVLYARVKAKNKKFVLSLVRKSGASLSVVVDEILDRVREENSASNAGKSSRDD